MVIGIVTGRIVAKPLSSSAAPSCGGLVAQSQENASSISFPHFAKNHLNRGVGEEFAFQR
jgi:hypothetical protein